MGLKLSFINSGGKVETWEFQGGAFTATSSWKQQSSGGNKILEWVTDAATTRLQVPVNERKEGMQISYRNEDGDWVNEQYIGTNLKDAYWAADGNWDRFLAESDYEKRGYSVFKIYDALKNDESNLIGNNNSEYAVQYTDISDADYIDAIIRCFDPKSPGITFWSNKKSQIASYNANTGQYIDGNNFRFFLKKTC